MFLLLHLLVLMVASSRVIACPSVCSCRWKSGKDTVECVGRSLAEIPAGVSPLTQVLDISNNNLHQLVKGAFVEAKLTHLQRLYVSHCDIDHVEKGAFFRLTNLIELDMSDNKLPSIPSQALRDCPALRRLIVVHNPITTLEDEIFSFLTQLRQLELTRCEIVTISSKAFAGLRSLTHLKLDGNRLVTLSSTTLSPLKSLHTFEIHGNPWRCDCYLKGLRTWIDKSKIPFSMTPVCTVPSRLRGKSIQSLSLDELACPPRSSTSHRRAEVQEGQTVTFTCLVMADPLPNITWLLDSLPLSNISDSESEVLLPFKIREIESNETKQSILVIANVTPQLTGRYTCTAENRAGKFQANYTLVLWKGVGQPASLTNGQLAGIGFGVAFGLATFTVVFLLLLLKGHAKLKSITANSPRAGGIVDQVWTSVTQFYHHNRKRRKPNEDEKKAINVGSNPTYNSLLCEPDHAAAATFLAAIKPDVININDLKEQIVAYQDEITLQPTPCDTDPEKVPTCPRLELVLSPSTPGEAEDKSSWKTSDDSESKTRSCSPSITTESMLNEKNRDPDKDTRNDFWRDENSPEKNCNDQEDSWDSYYRSLYNSCKNVPPPTRPTSFPQNTTNLWSPTDEFLRNNPTGVSERYVRNVRKEFIPENLSSYKRDELKRDNHFLPNHRENCKISNEVAHEENIWGNPAARLKNFFATRDFWNNTFLENGPQFPKLPKRESKRNSFVLEESDIIEESSLEDAKESVPKDSNYFPFRQFNKPSKQTCDDTIEVENEKVLNRWSDVNPGHAQLERNISNHPKWRHLVPVLPPLPLNQRVRLRKANGDENGQT